jgi:hypothetical protein
MLLKPPFIIGSALSPALNIGDSTLHLTDVQAAEGGRDRATFLLVTPEFEYVDDQLRSGVGGFQSTVGIFESFLGFMQAACESAEYEERTGYHSENSGLFPRHVVEWALEHKDAIEMAICEITDEDGYPNESLIEE